MSPTAGHAALLPRGGSVVELAARPFSLSELSDLFRAAASSSTWAPAVGPVANNPSWSGNRKVLPDSADEFREDRL